MKYEWKNFPLAQKDVDHESHFHVTNLFLKMYIFPLLQEVVFKHQIS